jgi:hypothetical protein
MSGTRKEGKTMNHGRNILVAAFMLLALSAALAQTDKAKPDPATWAPAEALFFVGVADVDQTWADFKKTASYSALNDDALSAIPNAQMLKIAADKLQEKLAKILEVPKAQLKNPFGGGLAAYVVAPHGAKPDDVQVALVAGLGDKELMKTYYAAAVKKLRASATDYEAVAAGSNSIDVFTSKKGEKKDGDEGEKKDEEEDDEENAGFMGGPDVMKAIEKAIDKPGSPEAMPPKLATCLTEDRLIVANSPDEVKAVLRRGREGENLTGTDDYKALAQTFKPLGSVRLLVNLPRIMELSRGEDAEEATKTANMLGAKSLRAVIGHAVFGGEKFDSKAEVQVLVNGERTGLVKIFSMENRELTPPAGVSADTLVYAAINVNPLGIADEVERMIRQNDADQADEMHKAMEEAPMPSGEKVNVREQLLSHLRGPLTFALAAVKPYGPESARLLLSLAHNDKESLEKFFGQMRPYLNPRDVDNAQVFDVPMAAMSVAPAASRLLIGDTKSVEAALASGKAEGLAADPAFKRAAEAMPREAWGVFYVDSKRMVQTLIGLAEKKADSDNAETAQPGMNPAAMMLEAMTKSMSTAGKDKEKGKSNVEQMRGMLRYAAPTIVTLATNGDGVRLTYVLLKPEKE